MREGGAMESDTRHDVPVAFELKGDLCAVSYTHLDVYKRQVDIASIR